jgi:hypothetical protein
MAAVPDQPRITRLDGYDVVKVGDEGGLMAADHLIRAGAERNLGPGGEIDAMNPGDEPFRIAAENAHAGGKLRCGGRHQNSCGFDYLSGGIAESVFLTENMEPFIEYAVKLRSMASLSGNEAPRVHRPLPLGGGAPWRYLGIYPALVTGFGGMAIKPLFLTR